MAEHMRCAECKAEMGMDADLYCAACYTKLRAENGRLEDQLKMQKAWLRSWYKAMKRAEAAQERLQAKLRRLTGESAGR